MKHRVLLSLLCLVFAISVQAQVRLITNVEYSIDNGAYTPIDVADGASVNWASGSISTTGLADGIHRIHVRGTDDQGRDVFARVIYGFRISVLFGLVLTLGFLGYTAITMIEPAAAKFSRGQTTLVLEIDLFYFWIPILFGFYLASAATLWLIVHRLIKGDPLSPPPSGPQ